jgi:ABC-type transport system involved in multi-copper enzyme maturation permease subunit
VKFKTEQEHFQENIKQHQATTKVYTEDMSRSLSNNLFYLAPPQSESIAMRKRGFPNTIATKATIFSPQTYDKTNQSKNTFELNWLFIIGMLGSFAALLFSYDAISQEKELGGLRLLTINGVTRIHCLLSKYLSVMIIFSIAFILGFLFSMAIVYIMLGSISFALFIKLLIFLGISILFISFFVLAGIRISMSRNIRSNIVVALTIWLIFLIIIPNLATIVGTQVYPLKSSGYYHSIGANAYNEVFNDWAEKCEGKGNSEYNPVRGNGDLESGFRAQAVWESESAWAKVDDESRMEAIKQVKLTENLAMISPYSVLEKIGEIILDQGLYRYNRELIQFSDRFEKIKQTLIEEDAKDPKSIHLFYSWAAGDDWRDDIDTFTHEPYPNPQDFILTNYTQDSLSNKFHQISMYLAILLGFNLLMFAINTIKIRKFDIR